LWEHQSQILHDFEEITKRQKSTEEAASAAFQVAMCYISGFGTKKDLQASAKFIQEAEERNHSAAKLFGQALKFATSNAEQQDDVPTYETRVILGLKLAHYIGPSTALAVQWKSRDLKSPDHSEILVPKDPPLYEDVTHGDIAKDSVVTKVFQSYTELRSWIVRCAGDGSEPFLLTSETSITTVPPSFKTNLLECAIITEDIILVTLLSKHINSYMPGYLGDLPLITACRTGNIDIVRECLSGNTNPSQKQPDGSTMFHWIFMLGVDVRSIFEIPDLLESGVEMEVLGSPCVAPKLLHLQWPLQLVGTPLAFSIAACSLTGVAALLQLGADPLAPILSLDQDSEKNWWTPLHLAVKHHSPEMLVLLLLGLPKHEADIDTGILTAVKARLAKIPYIFEALGGKRSPLTKALTGYRHSVSLRDRWDATIGCALSYSTTVERIAIHGIYREKRLAETIALLPLSCLGSSSKVGKTALMQAIDFNDLAVVTALLKRFPKLASNAFLDPLDGQFTYPIHFASQIAGHRDSDDALEILKILIQYEPDQMSLRDSKGKTPLHYSVTGSSDRATKWLIENGCPISAADDRGQAALHSAQSIRNLVALLDAGAVVNQQDKTGMAPIHVLVSPGSEDLVKALLDRGASPNLKDRLGQTALHCAVAKRSREVCGILLDAGADMNMRTKSGDSPLHLAIQSTRSDIVKLLLETGADISAINSELFTPLHLSVFTGDYVCFNQVLASVHHQEPALVNAIDLKKQTALHIATIFVRTAMAEKLLQYGAKADMVNEDGNNAFHLVVESDPSLGHSQADKVDFLALLYSHWTTTAAPDVNKTDLIAAQLNAENAEGKTPWDLAYQQKTFTLMDFLIVKGGFDVCRQLQMDGEYIGNKLLKWAIDGDEWDLVITLLRHHSVLEMHPILKDHTLKDLYMALRMNDKFAVKQFLQKVMNGRQEEIAGGLKWLDGNIADFPFFRSWKGKEGDL
jgi:ankyrin repeat protein